MPSPPSQECPISGKGNWVFMLVDDRPMVIEGVKALLQHAENIDVVGTANDAFSTMRFLKEQKVDVVLLDINLPDLSGIVCQSTDSR